MGGGGMRVKTGGGVRGLRQGGGGTRVKTGFTQ